MRRADGQMVQLGPLMYALLEEVDGERDNDALAAAMSERLGRTLEAGHVVRIGEKLAEQGLLAGSEDNAPPRMNPLLALRWKVLFTNPKVTRRITAPFEALFRPWILIPAAVGFLAVCWFVLIHQGVAAATSQAFDNPELLLLVLGLTVASAALHEIGHAAACRYGGGRPGGMGAGIYIVWPAFYTDVTDAYRLPRVARLRTDLGGIYFNSVISVITLGVWLATGVDALLLLIAIQMLEIVKNLSPMIRSDGYHILSDATGVPDLYAHMGPTLKRLLPWKKNEPSALKGWARIFVTAWVLIIVPILLSMAFSAILLFPKMAASAWESGSHLVSAVPDQAGDGDVLGLLASVARLFALALPVAGVTLLVKRMVVSTGRKAWGWSGGQTPRQAARARRRGRPDRRAHLGLVAVRPVPPRAPDRQRHAGGRLQDRERAGGRGPPERRGGAAATVAGPPPGRRADPARRADRGASGAVRRQRRRRRRQADDPRQPRRARRPQGAEARRPRAPAGPEPGRPRPTERRPPARPRRPRTRRPRPRRPPSSRSSSRRAGRGRLAGARHQHHRRRHRLRHRLLARHRVRRRAGRQRELRLRARELRRLHDLGGLLPARPRRRAERPDHADQRRRGAQSRLPELHHDRDREADRGLGHVRALRGAAAPADRRAQEAGRDRHDDSPAEVLAQVNAVSEAIQRELDESGITYPKATPTPAPATDPGRLRDAGRERDAGVRGQSHADAHATPSPTPTATATPTETATPLPTPTATTTPSPTATPAPPAPTP